MEINYRLKRPILVGLCCLMVINTYAQKQTLNDGSIQHNFEWLNHQLHGQYVSYYANGIKKAEGMFEHNNRVGEWSAWDSTGILKVKRDYTNLFEYKQIIPAVSNDPPIALLNKPSYELTYNEKGFIPYFYLQERMVVWSTRIWRKIEPANNPWLFEKNQFYETITKYHQSGELDLFSAQNDQFSEKIDFLKSPENYQVIAYKLKEDTFFDHERLLSESRILGICPVAIDLTTKDTVDLYWVYFPQLRPLLAKEKIVSEIENMKTFDDLFFFRHFYGEIYKESNVFDRAIKEYSEGDDHEKEVLRIEFSLIDTEHNYWLKFAN